MLTGKRNLNSPFHIRAGAFALGIAWSLIASNVSAQVSEEGARLLAAERALLEGLSSKGGSNLKAQDDRRNSATAELKPVTYSHPPMDPNANQEAHGLGDDVTGRLDRSNQIPKRIEASNTMQREMAPAPAQADRVSEPTLDLRVERELESRNARIAQLEKELDQVKGQLTMAETELSRLATINEARTRARLNVPNTSSPASTPARLGGSERGSESPLAEPTPSGTKALNIATVGVENGELRLGPGKDHSVLMNVSKGARLAVEARQGEWLRVFAPNGMRAWIVASAVVFGNTGSNAEQNGSSLRVRGYSGSLEDQAFNKVQVLSPTR